MYAYIFGLYIDIKAVDVREIQHIQITLKQGIEVHGYAEYADGVPAAGLEVSAEPDWWHCRYSADDCPIDEQGNFTLAELLTMATPVD